jgi:hypothetical protein
MSPTCALCGKTIAIDYTVKPFRLVDHNCPIVGLPDPVAERLAKLEARVAELERETVGQFVRRLLSRRAP